MLIVSSEQSFKGLIFLQFNGKFKNSAFLAEMSNFGPKIIFCIVN